MFSQGLELLGKVKQVKRRYWIGAGGLATATAMMALMREARPWIEAYATPTIVGRVEKVENGMEAVTIKLVAMEKAVATATADQKERDKEQMRLLKAIAKSTGAEPRSVPTPVPDKEEEP